jgi:ketosteroid isomerase-like protein
MSEVTGVRGAVRRMPIGMALALMVLIGAVGFAAGWLLHAEREPAAEVVANDLAEIIQGSHSALDQAEDTEQVAALYAVDAVATDAPSGAEVEGRDAIAGGWQDMFAQGPSVSADVVLGDDRWAAIVSTWSGTNADGVQASAPILLLLEVREGKIVSELDIYDSATFPFFGG